MSADGRGKQEAATTCTMLGTTMRSQPRRSLSWVTHYRVDIAMAGKYLRSFWRLSCRRASIPGATCERTLVRLPMFCLPAEG